MIRITQLKLPADHKADALRDKAARTLGLNPWKTKAVHIRRQSLDARKKPELFYSYTVDVELGSGVSGASERAIVHKAKMHRLCFLGRAITAIRIRAANLCFIGR